MNIYASRNAVNGIIENGAAIVCFDSRAAAEAWLFAGHTHADGLFPRVKAMRVSRGWKTTNPNGSVYPGPIEDAKLCAPFKMDEINTEGPDDHQCGSHLWHTPKPDVLVLVDVPRPGH